MGISSRAGDYAFKALTASLGLATIYLTATFSDNVYRGLSWHNAQSKLDKQDSGSDRLVFTATDGCTRMRWL